MENSPYLMDKFQQGRKKCMVARHQEGQTLKKKRVYS